LKTDGGYPRDAGVFISFTMANPGSSLRFNTHWSAPPVAALARSGGPRKMSQSPVSLSFFLSLFSKTQPNHWTKRMTISRNSKKERRMDRPKAVVGVIRRVAKTVDVNCLLWAGFGIYGVSYLRAIGALPGRLGRGKFVLDGL